MARKLFAVSPIPSNPYASIDSRGAVNSVGGSLEGAMKVGQAIKGRYDRLSPENQQKLKNTIRGAATNVTRKFAGDRSKVNTKTGNRRNSDDNGNFNFGGSRGFALSNSPEPKPVSLNTGVVPNTYVSDYMDAEENKCSPLHLSGARLTLPTDVSQTLYTFFQNVIAFELQTRAQANVGFNLNITTTFNSANILVAMNALIYALQVCYYFTSIITYCDNPDNKNEGMIYLRNKILADDLENLALLKRRLKSTPVPPNLLELVRYLHSNWYSGDTQGSPILKIVPEYFGAEGLSGDFITTALDGLATTTNNEIFSLIRRAIPQWIPSSLPDVPIIPTYDANFLTIFANLPFTYWNTTTSTVGYQPSVSTADENISYNSFTNNLDGVAFALASVRNSASPGYYYPGLMIPTTDSTVNNGGSRRSYYEVSGTKRLFNTSQYAFLNRSRNETYYLSDLTAFTVSSGHNSGTDRCKGVSANSIKETTLKAVEYLMSLDTIKRSVVPDRRSGRG